MIADSTWSAIQGRKALEIEWDEAGHGSENTAEQRAKCAELAQKPGQEVTKVGDPDAAFAKAATKLEAVYEVAVSGACAYGAAELHRAFQGWTLHGLGAYAECAGSFGGGGSCVGDSYFECDRACDFDGRRIWAAIECGLWRGGGADF